LFTGESDPERQPRLCIGDCPWPPPTISALAHSPFSVGYSRYQNGGYPSGSAIVDALLRDPEPVVASMRDPANIKNLLRLDRQLLELYASRGRNISRYTARKAELGLK